MSTIYLFFTFQCKVRGCNKIFRRESVLRQHHKHYHLQRYKLRDQETTPAVKRKASKDDLRTFYLISLFSTKLSLFRSQATQTVVCFIA